MQVVNTDSFKAFEGLQPQGGYRQDGPSMGVGSFRDAVRKVIEGDSQATAMGVVPAVVNPSDRMMGELIGMMGQAEVIEAGIPELPVEPEEELTAQPVDPGIPMAIVLPEAAVPIAGQQVRETQKAPAAQAVAQPENIPKEKPARATGQQTAHTETAKAEPAVKERQESEKPAAAKSGENIVKNAEVKQDTTKEVRQEFTGQAKQEAVADPEKVYVKVSEGNKLNSERFASDVSDKIFTKMSEGAKQFEIELAPKELGKILIKLIMLDGKAEIMIQCLNPKTQQLVTQSAETIRGIIEERTGAQTTVTVKEEDAKEGLERDGKHGRQDGQQEQKHQEKKWDEAETVIFLQQLRLGLTEELKT